jgi:L-lysine 6-transaminase
LQDHPHDIAAIIIEPVQGEGGDNHFRDEFMTSLRQICDENEMMFIMDEVQTGVGITGKWWAHEHFTSKPDIIAFGKKAQVCGMLSSNRVDEVKQNVFSESSRINSTFGGNLTDMVRFQLILEIITDENLLENAKKMGNILLTGIRDLELEFPAFVTNARGLGLFAAFDLPSPTERDRLISKLIENKLMMLPSGDQSVRFRPHLNVIEEDLSLALEITKTSLKSILN